MNEKTSLLQPERIEQVILLIRGQRVMLDRDLAVLYCVETKNLNKAVRRNLDRFPEDFMFQLTFNEAQACAASRFQFGTLKRGQNIKYLPHAFTQEGVAMLSSVLREKKVTMPDEFTHDVLLSHNLEDKAPVRQLVRILVDDWEIRFCSYWVDACGPWRIPHLCHQPHISTA